MKEEDPVFLTKNGYGSMVVLSLEQYANLSDIVEAKLDEADRQAASTTQRLSHREIFDHVRRNLDGE